MSHLAVRYFGRVNRKTAWPSPQKENRLTLSPPRRAALGGWEMKGLHKCEETHEISEGYKAAIALLRSLRNVDEAERQRQRDSWEMLEQDLDEGRYH